MKSGTPYPIYCIDEDLRLGPLETINHIGHTPREDCLDEGGESILGNRATHQALPCLLAGVCGGGWVKGVVRMPCRIGIRRGWRWRCTAITDGISTSNAATDKHRMRGVLDKTEVLVEERA